MLDRRVSVSVPRERSRLVIGTQFDNPRGVVLVARGNAGLRLFWQPPIRMLHKNCNSSDY